MRNAAGRLKGKAKQDYFSTALPSNNTGARYFTITSTAYSLSSQPNFR